MQDHFKHSRLRWFGRFYRMGEDWSWDKLRESQTSNLTSISQEWQNELRFHRGIVEKTTASKSEWHQTSVRKRRVYFFRFWKHFYLICARMCSSFFQNLDLVHTQKFAQQHLFYCSITVLEECFFPMSLIQRMPCREVGKNAVLVLLLNDFWAGLK